MKKKRLKNHHLPGRPPGDLTDFASDFPSDIKLSLIEYDETTFIEKNDITLDECLKMMRTPSVSWIQVNGLNDLQAVEKLGKYFNLDSLLLEDILDVHQRSKLDATDKHLFMILKYLSIDDKDEELHQQQLSLVVGVNYLITFIEEQNGFFAPLMQRLRNGEQKLRKSATDYLAYSILDMVVDYNFSVLEKVELRLDHFEEEAFLFPSAEFLPKIQKTKRDMVILRKSIWPIREIVNQLQKVDPPLMNNSTQPYLRDVYDHLIQLIDILEGFRDILSGISEVYLSSLNIKTNEIMKFLTIVSTLFVPLTFISSLYGMNFDYMPELRAWWGYPLTLSIMFCVSCGMLYYFRTRKWI